MGSSSLGIGRSVAGTSTVWMGVYMAVKPEEAVMTHEERCVLFYDSSDMLTIDKGGYPPLRREGHQDNSSETFVG